MTPTLSVCLAADRDAINQIIGIPTGWNMEITAPFVPAVPTPDFNTPVSNYAMMNAACPNDQSVALVNMAAGTLPTLLPGYSWGGDVIDPGDLVTVLYTLPDETTAAALFEDNKFQTITFGGMTDAQVNVALFGDGTPENLGVLRGTIGILQQPQDI